jgi:hypothetical protein
MTKEKMFFMFLMIPPMMNTKPKRQELRAHFWQHVRSKQYENYYLLGFFIFLCLCFQSISRVQYMCNTTVIIPSPLNINC